MNDTPNDWGPTLSLDSIRALADKIKSSPHLLALDSIAQAAVQARAHAKSFAAFHEYGTSKVQPRPFLDPASMSGFPPGQVAKLGHNSFYGKLGVVASKHYPGTYSYTSARLVPPSVFADGSPWFAVVLDTLVRSKPPINLYAADYERLAWQSRGTLAEHREEIKLALAIADLSPIGPNETTTE